MIDPRPTPEEVTALFTAADGSFRFARWERPIVPVIMGVDDDSLPVLKGAIEAVVASAGHKMSDMDPELGVNLMVFFLRDWQELAALPDLHHLIPGLDDLLGRLEAADAKQYRLFRFEKSGAIRAAFVFVRLTGEMAEQPAETLALDQALRALLLWSETAFAEQSPLVADPQGNALLRPEIAAVLASAYDPLLPSASEDPSHAMRLSARATLKLASADWEDE